MSKLIKFEKEKNIREVIESIKQNASNFNFIVRNVFNMKDEFKNHGVDVDTNFEYYSIMLCNPPKAYTNIVNNPIRGAILLPPKQIVVFKENNKTVLVYVAMEENDIKSLLPEDTIFQKGMSNSCNKIVELMKSI